jgi:hypothetical protein
MKSRSRTFVLLATLFTLVACSSETTTPTAETPKDAAPAPAADVPAAPAPSSESLLYGTWVLNLSKSTYSPADLKPMSNKVVFEKVPSGVHVITDGVNAQGKATHSDYTATFDGPDIPTNGTVDGKPNPDVDSAAWKKIDDHTYEITNKRKGKIVQTNRIVIAADGKSRTSTVTGTTPKGDPINNTIVMDKQ